MNHKAPKSRHRPLSQIRHLPRTGLLLGSRFAALTKFPIFILLTLVVHSVILFCAWVFYLLEWGHNNKLVSFIDALFWSVATVTTVGYGDIVPITFWGKVLAMFTMIFGSLCLVLYTAFFAGALIAPELNQVESKVKNMDDEVKEVTREIKSDEEIQKVLLNRIENLISKIDKGSRSS
ncbi:MAG: potassium channel family protein [Proteobacteria bacterium]|nr:potassium channel family protein [Pseudomonadota bacterium]